MNAQPYAAPAFFQAVTERFDAFCESHLLTVLARCAARHWCWEWTGWRKKAKALNRYVTLFALDDPFLRNRYIIEVWAEADTDTAYARKRQSRLRFSQERAGNPGFAQVLDGALSAAWRTALEFRQGDLRPHASKSVRIVRRVAAEHAAPRVLLVEDSAVVQKAVRRILDQLGYDLEVEEARDGLEALQLAVLKKPALLILDVHMPEMTGLQFLKELRANPRLSSLPIMVLNAAAITEAKQAESLALELEAHPLDRPCDLDELKERLARILDAHSVDAR